MKMRKLVCRTTIDWDGPRRGVICQPVAQTLTKWFFAEYPGIGYDKDQFVDLIRDFNLNKKLQYEKS